MIVIQAELLVAVQVQAIDAPTEMDPLDPVAGTVTDNGDMDIAHPCPACVTVAVWPPMIKVAVRSMFVLFAAILMNTDPLPVPAPLVIVIHGAVLVVVHEQVLAVVTVIPLN